MSEAIKEVFFDIYCPTCKHFEDSSDKDPCDECLSNPGNVNSHKPIMWEDK